MTTQQTQEAAILEALRTVQDPDLGRDIVSLNFVKDLRVEDGDVSFAIELTTPACPVKEQMHDEAVAAVSRLDGVTKVTVDMTANVRAVDSPEAGKVLIDGVKNVVAVGAGKGGVGKSTVAVNLALALSRCGGRVGVIDADVYGPNIPIMLGISTQLETDGKKIVPARSHGIPVVSMGFLTKDETPIIWRGPMLHGVVKQFFHDVRWGELDYLVVDMPPGTGDVALSLSQSVPVSGAVVVTTPQVVSLADSRRAVAMYKKLNVPVLGLVENMSHFACPSCHEESDIFGKGGGETAAEEMGIPFLGRIPLSQPIREGGDSGLPIVDSEPDSAAARGFLEVAERTAARVSIAALSSPESVVTAS
ncbi:MAG: hypothetical protein CL484_06265 [Acidobacteria bacterium]|nr:hypothetical protein [Acidobacteriota bacterium]